MIRIASAQGVELDELASEADFCADQAQRPGGIDLEAMTKHEGMTGRVGAAQVDELALRRGGGLEVESGWPEAPFGRALDPLRTACAERVHIGHRASLEMRQIAMHKAVPDFGLPAAIVVFNGGLEAGFAWGSKDGNDFQLQAQAHDPTDGIGVMMSALEEGIVVELGVGREAVLAPVRGEIGQHQIGAEDRMRPGTRQAAQERDGVEDFHALATSDDQTFDAIEAIEFGLAVGDPG